MMRKKEQPIKEHVFFSRKTNETCRKCRKRESCLIQPKPSGFCPGLDPGEPYEDPNEQYWRSLDEYHKGCCSDL